MKIQCGRDWANTFRRDELVVAAQQQFVSNFDGADKETKAPSRAQLHVADNMDFDPATRLAIQEFGEPSDMLELNFAIEGLSAEQQGILKKPSIFGFGKIMRYFGAPECKQTNDNDTSRFLGVRRRRVFHPANVSPH